MARAWIGTSGYQYDHWRGVLYPEGVPKRGWFEEYAQHFDTVEINNTFYRLPEAETFKTWYDEAPEGFCYALKYSRYGSHLKRLKDPAGPLETFTSRARELKEHLGPILVQLPGNWQINMDRLQAFLEAAPREYRWALEFRDSSWLCDPVYDLLREHNAALVLHDMLPDHPREITADWVYLRFHGDHYQGSYSSQFLTAEAERIAAELREGRDVYAYFNNDQAGYAAMNAQDLERYLADRHPES